VGAGLALGGCGPSAASLDGETSPPPLDVAKLPTKYPDHHIVLVSFDALQAAHVGAWGYSRDVTPTIDAVARDGLAFLKTYSVASWTVPASMTWFTGVYPSEHRMTNKYAVYNSREQKPARLKDLAPGLVTLAQTLRGHGYATGGFTGNAGVSGGFGYDQGFDTYFFEREKFGGFQESVPRALAWLRENRRRKCFLFLHGYDAHGQFAPIGGFDYRFVDRTYDGKYTGSEQEQELLREEGLARGRLTLRDADVRFWRAIYDEKIQRADARFARFLRDFERLGLADKTLLVLTSDHGTEFFEHGRFDHGFTLYNEQIHVPLIIRLPGQKGGSRLADTVSSIDVMPTILDLLDIPLSERLARQLRGTSLVPTMLGRHQPRDVFAETDYREYTFKRSIVTSGGWKLIYTLESGYRELYDLTVDPAELHDLAESQPARADELLRRLAAHFHAIGHDLASRKWNVGLNPVYPSQGLTLPRQ
jgi:arylsulfatase A-like enzyme